MSSAFRFLEGIASTTVSLEMTDVERSDSTTVFIEACDVDLECDGMMAGGGKRGGGERATTLGAVGEGGASVGALTIRGERDVGVTFLRTRVLDRTGEAESVGSGSDGAGGLFSTGDDGDDCGTAGFLACLG